MMDAALEQVASNDTEVLRDLNENFIRAVNESDAAWFDRNVTSDFLNSNADGSLSDRAQFLSQIAKPPSVVGIRAEDVRIRVLGDVAIIHGRTTFTKADRKPGAGRYTDVYVRERGRWLCVAAHVTRG
jgi:ketosteroid isomerase-like protein